ncbi:MAG: hypothetical protein ACYDHW_10895 [Syntrophorhabdaceae bacterium]
MVSELIWKNRVKEFCELANLDAKRNGVTAMAIYDRIKDNYVNADIERGFDEMIDHEIKLSWSTCRRYFDKMRNIRMDADAQRSKAKEKTETVDMMSHAEIKELIDMILLKKKPDTTPDYIKANATLFLPDNRRLDAWIDHSDPNFKYGKAITVRYEQDGGHMVRCLHLDLKMVNHKILTGENEPAGAMGTMGKQYPLKIVDDDFIPELEVDDAVQGTLGLD